jgi:DNA-binding GntR family transcriptional regulator
MKSLASRKNYRDYLTINIDFHLLFPRVTGSSELFDILSQLRKRTFRFYYAQITMVNDPEQYVNDHQDIIDALRGKIHEKPEKLMERHIDRTRKSFLNFYRKFGI